MKTVLTILNEAKNRSEAKSVTERKRYRTGSKKDLCYEGMRAPARSRDSAETEKIDEQKCRQGLGNTTKELASGRRFAPCLELLAT